MQGSEKSFGSQFGQMFCWWYRKYEINSFQDFQAFSKITTFQLESHSRAKHLCKHAWFSKVLNSVIYFYSWLLINVLHSKCYSFGCPCHSKASNHRLKKKKAMTLIRGSEFPQHINHHTQWEQHILYNKHCKHFNIFLNPCHPSLPGKQSPDCFQQQNSLWIFTLCFSGISSTYLRAPYCTGN